MNVSHHSVLSGSLAFIGDTSILDDQLTGFFAASAAPSDLILPTLDIALNWPAGSAVVGGFQSPLEQAVLATMLSRSLPVLLVTPVAVRGDRLPPSWREGLEKGKLTLGWPLDAKGMRSTEKLAASRNRHLMAVVSSLVIVSGSTASRAYRIASEAATAGVPLLCHDHPRERDLVLLGARPIGSKLEWREVLKGPHR